MDKRLIFTVALAGFGAGFGTGLAIRDEQPPQNVAPVVTESPDDQGWQEKKLAKEAKEHATAPVLIDDENGGCVGSKADELRKEFPELLSKCFDISIGNGWVLLVKEALKEIEKERVAHPTDTNSVDQIKEKFGGLRIYATTSPAGFHAVEQAEKKAAETCEDCGSHGKLRRGGWLRTLCDACEEKQKH